MTCCDPSNVISVVATVSSSTYFKEPGTVPFHAAPPIWKHFLKQDSLVEKFQLDTNYYCSNLRFTLNQHLDLNLNLHLTLNLTLNPTYNLTLTLL